MDISIVITTRDRKKDLLECLSSIRNSNFDNLKWEIIVVDDCSSDGTENIEVGDLGIKNSRIVHNKLQQMMVRSRNIGAEESEGKYVLFVDDDNVVDSGMIINLSDFMDQNSDYGIIGPSMYHFDSKKKYLDYQKINLYNGHTKGLISKTEKQICDSDGIPNIFMIRKKVFEMYGYFDDGLLQTFTEPDFAMRIGKEGYKCGIVPKAITYHKVQKEDSYKPRGLGGEFNQKAYCLMRNRTVYISRYGNILNKIIYILVFSLFWPVAYSVFSLAHRRKDLTKMYWMGFVDGITYFFTGKLINSLGTK